MTELISFRGKTESINVAQEIGIQWWVVGTALLDDKKGTIMPAIAQQFGNNTLLINMEVLSRWVQGKGIPDCTWRALLGALRGPCRALAESMLEALTVDPEEKATDSEPGKHTMQCVTYMCTTLKTYCHMCICWVSNTNLSKMS